jgi:hypothetical protein
MPPIINGTPKIKSFYTHATRKRQLKDHYVAYIEQPKTRALHVLEPERTQRKE